MNLYALTLIFFVKKMEYGGSFQHLIHQNRTNGVGERKNRTVVEMAGSMLQAKGLPTCFWAEAVATTVYILNLSPTRAVRD